MRTKVSIILEITFTRICRVENETDHQVRESRGEDLGRAKRKGGDDDDEW